MQLEINRLLVNFMGEPIAQIQDGRPLFVWSIRRVALEALAAAQSKDYSVLSKILDLGRRIAKCKTDAEQKMDISEGDKSLLKTTILSSFPQALFAGQIIEILDALEEPKPTSDKDNVTNLAEIRDAMKEKK